MRSVLVNNESVGDKVRDVVVDDNNSTSKLKGIFGLSYFKIDLLE